MRKSLEMIIEHLHIPQGIDTLLSEYKAYSLQQWAGATLALNPGVKKLMGELRTNDIPLALATSANGTRMELFLRKLGISDAFRGIVCGDDITHSKPAPDIYLLAARKLGIEPENCVAIEDATAGVASAKTAGMKVIGYKVPPSKQDLSVADIVVGNFDEITLKALRAL